MPDTPIITDEIRTQVSEAINKMKEMSKTLPGKTIILAPDVSFYVDENNQFSLTAFGSQDRPVDVTSDNVVVKEGWKLFGIMKGIRAGILRVLDVKGSDITKAKDITDAFGGPAVSTLRQRRDTPLVEEGVPRIDPDNKIDEKLLLILSNPDEDKVLTDIVNRKPSYAILDRLLKLEKAGNNPTFTGRLKVVDGITEMIKKTSGFTILEEKEDKVITTNKK